MLKELIKEYGLENFVDVIFKNQYFLLVHFLLNGRNIYIGYYVLNGKYKKVFQQEDNVIVCWDDVPYYYANEVIKKYLPQENLIWQTGKE